MKHNPKNKHKLYSLYKCLYHWEYLTSGETSKEEFKIG